MDRWLSLADVAVGFTVLGCAFLLVAPPAMRVLLASVGVMWLLETLVPALVGIHRAVLAVGLLAFPSGRLDGRVRWVLAVAAVVLAFGVSPQAGVAAFFVMISVALIVLADRELIWAAAIAALLVGMSMAFSWGMRTFDPSSFDPRHQLLVYQGAVLGAGVVLCGATRFRLMRSRGFTNHLLAIETSGGLAGLAVLLRVALRDPELEIAPAGTDSHVRRHLARVEVRDGDTIVAELRHRRGSIPDERARRSVVEAIRLAAAQSQRTRELELRGLELAATGNRLALAADRRRANVSGRLSDEVLWRIDEAVAVVESALRRSAVPEAGSALAIAREELSATKEDVRLIVENGQRPGGGQLSTALRGLAARSPLVRVHADPAAVADSDTETALYYVAAEAVTNALKHAEASRIDVTLTRAGDELLLSVHDNGRGGADPSMAGLDGLRSRVEASGGHLEMTSLGGFGTTITAQVMRSSTMPR